MKHNTRPNSLSHRFCKLFVVLFFMVIVHDSAHGKRKGTIHLEVHGGYASSSVNVVLGGDTQNYDFRGPQVSLDFGLRFGRRKITHDLSLNIQHFGLTNQYSAINSDNHIVTETLQILGGGFKYGLNGPLGRKFKRLGFLVSLNGGFYQATLTREELQPDVQTYASGFGGIGSLALVFKLSRKKGSGAELILGTSGTYILLSRGTDQNSRARSDLAVTSGSGYLGLAINI